MPSKQVTDRQKSADSVIAALDTHGGAAAEALASVLSPHLEPAQPLPPPTGG